MICYNERKTIVTIGDIDYGKELNLSLLSIRP